jgi:hypothetical protein
LRKKPLDGSGFGVQLLENRYLSSFYGLRKDQIPSLIREERTSGANGHVDLAGFLPGLKPRPTLKEEFFRKVLRAGPVA